MKQIQGVPKKLWFKLIFEFLTLGGVFLGTKNNSKNFGNKKKLGCLAKFWVKVDLVLFKFFQFSWFFRTLSVSKGQKSFEESKYLIFICEHASILTFMIIKKVFHSWYGHKLIKHHLHFSDKQCLFTQNFTMQPYILFVPKVLRIICKP